MDVIHFLSDIPVNSTLEIMNNLNLKLSRHDWSGEVKDLNPDFDESSKTRKPPIVNCSILIIGGQACPHFLSIAIEKFIEGYALRPLH